MEIVIISIAAFFTAILTFFSGFGLGTIMMPVFAFFFPIDVAIALTGVVHFANNFFKLLLVGRDADKTVLLRFGLPAFLAAIFGAWLLIHLSSLPVLYSYTMWGRGFEISLIKLTIALILFVFAILEIMPAFRRLQFDKNKLVIGGVLSGFLGGLSGIQGALRSAFLIKSGLSKEAYIATAVVIACIVDLSRLSVYATKFLDTGLYDNMALLISAVVSAIAGAYLGKRLLHKVTLKSVQYLVVVMLILVSLGMGTGLI